MPAPRALLAALALLALSAGPAAGQTEASDCAVFESMWDQANKTLPWTRGRCCSTYPWTQSTLDGFKCAGGRITMADLTARGLVGVGIPDALSTVTYLQTIYLDDDSLSGPLPNISNLVDLQTIVFYLNGGLSGSVDKLLPFNVSNCNLNGNPGLYSCTGDYPSACGAIPVRSPCPPQTPRPLYTPPPPPPPPPPAPNVTNVTVIASDSAGPGAGVLAGAVVGAAVVAAAAGVGVGIWWAGTRTKEGKREDTKMGGSQEPLPPTILPTPQPAQDKLLAPQSATQDSRVTLGQSPNSSDVARLSPMGGAGSPATSQGYQSPVPSDATISPVSDQTPIATRQPPHWFWQRIAAAAGHPPDGVIRYPSSTTFIAVRPFEPQNFDELRLVSGNMVEIKLLYPDGWAACYNTDLRQYGVVPVDCLNIPNAPAGPAYMAAPVAFLRQESGSRDVGRAVLSQRAALESDGGAGSQPRGW